MFNTCYVGTNIVVFFLLSMTCLVIETFVGAFREKLRLEIKIKKTNPECHNKFPFTLITT